MRVEQLLKSNLLDGWLMKEHGKFRMPMPKDETSLFRAIAEQVHSCQNFYGKVQNRCLQHIKNEESKLTEAEADMIRAGSNHSMKLPVHQQFQSLTEVQKLQVVSEVYQHNVILYRKLEAPVETIGIFPEGHEISLRLTEDGFYECIRSLDYMRAAAFCQAIVYGVLYEKVFKFDHETVDEAVQNVRTKAYNQFYQQRKTSYCSPNSSSGDEKSSPTNSPEKEATPTYPPFPFRAAKALDPDFFRNAQFDLYLDSRRETLHSIKPGDKVHVTIPGGEVDDRVFTGHVQEVTPNHGPVGLFVEELGRRTTVPYSSLVKLAPQKTNSGARQRVRRQFSSRRAFSDGSEEHSGSSPDCSMNQAKRAPLPPRFGQNRPSLSPPTGRPPYHSSPPVQRYPPRPTTNFTQQCTVNTDCWNPGLSQPIQTPPPYYNAQRPDVIYTTQPPPMQISPPPVFIPSAYDEENMVQSVAMSNNYIPQPPLLSMNAQFRPPCVDYYDSTGAYLGEGPYQQYEIPATTYYQESTSTITSPLPAAQVQPENPRPMAPIPLASALPVPYRETIRVGAVNYQAQPSCDPEGHDMPMGDIDTLRFFFNLGCEFYRGFATTSYSLGYGCSPLPPTAAPVTCLPGPIEQQYPIQPLRSAVQEQAKPQC